MFLCFGGVEPTTSTSCWEKQEVEVKGHLFVVGSI